MGWFKSKYEKLKRDDVVNAICELEKNESDLEEGIERKEEEIQLLLKKGKKEKSRESKLFIAKKINHLKLEKAEDMNRAMYLLYNVQLMRKLKNAIDDKEFIANVGNIQLNKLLMDQKGLAKFLNKALNTKIRTEDIMTEADSTFDEVKSMYEPNQKIYGVNNNDDDLLAMFETEDTLNMEMEMNGASKKETNRTAISESEE